MNNPKIALSPKIKNFVYFQPEVLRMLLLGFSAGLPLLLVLGTLSLLLKDAGVSRSDIGYASWIGLAYSIKVLWAPLVDNIKLPFVESLFGKRRSWLLLCQIGICFCLVSISYIDASLHLEKVIIFALVTAFFSATQDIVIDAFRVESNEDKTQGAAAGMYIMGYRLAMILAGAGALYLADAGSWEFSYQIMALCMAIGLIGWLLSPEPEHKTVAVGNSELEKRISNKLFSNSSHSLKDNQFVKIIIRSIFSPIVDFLLRFKWWGIVIIAFIATFRLSDIVMGVMAGVFYRDLGFTNSEIATISKLYGLIMTIVGALLGGYFANKLHILRCLFTASVLVILTNLLFTYMAGEPKSTNLLIAVISMDNLVGGFALGVLMTYLASLVNKEFTATQYALYTSLMTLFGKILGGFSGADVDAWGYELFFTYSAILGVPALLINIALMYREKMLNKK
ncbi:MFS transporter [Kangiella sp. HZ709]|uniref:AmpG family muropeptide MFS transporter n=1 Tax=Kangiella sp. HZ709 TaxID=2666328 RepID=UPI0012AFC82B|nr:MFS transporter [Kangiella sp. HZ709]MRX28561.1 MFS transporter [Kangiella sp. HZ709]